MYSLFLYRANYYSLQPKGFNKTSVKKFLFLKIIIFPLYIFKNYFEIEEF
jgi:hypothetical protein